MTIAKEGNRVKILLEGKLEDGTVFDRTDRSTPIEFTVGEGRMLPKIENAVKGMKVGEKKSFSSNHSQSRKGKTEDRSQPLLAEGT